MPRATYVLRDGNLVLKSEAAPLSAGPMLIRDGIDLTWHPANGKHYDSKSQFRRITKAHGCEEVGNERQTDRRQFDRVTKADVAQAVQMVQQGYRPNVLPESFD